MAAATAHWDFPRPMETAAILVQSGQQYGLSEARCLRGTGIAANRLRDPHASVTAGQELRLIRNLLGALGNDVPLGLEAGQRYRVTSFGIWGLAVLNARTMREAVEAGVRFARLTSAWTVPRIEDRGDCASMVVSTDGLPDDVSQFLLERDAAILMSIQRSMFPVRIALQSVQCTFPRPRYHKALDDFFNATVRYEQQENVIAVHQRLGELPVPSHNSSFFRRCAQECERLLEEREHHEGIAGAVRQAITRQLGKGATLERVSEELGMAPRTLRRKLASQGLDFQRLLAQTRHTLALRLLETTDYSVEEVSHQLGYRQATNFIRAFRGWQGVTPLQWQRSK